MNGLASANAMRILVADGDAAELERASQYLAAVGYQVRPARQAGEALDALRQQPFDLALVDVSLTDRARGALVERLAQFDHVPWIALIHENDLRAYDNGGRGPAAYVRRPVERAALLERVESVLRAGPSAEDDGRGRPALERRLIEQRTLSQLARSLSAVLDLDVLLTQVVDAAVSLCGAEEGMLLLPDDEDEALHVRAMRGLDSETARNFRIRTDDMLAGRVYRSGEPVLVGDQGPQKLKTEYLVKSLLYVPLSIKGKILGVLGVNNRHANHTFGEDDRELLEDLAAHAAVAIENARLFEESVRRAREQSMLVQAGEAANSTLALDQVLSIIAAQLITALDVNACYIADWQPAEQRLRMLAVSVRALWRPPSGPTLSLTDHPAIKQAFTHKRPVQAEAPPDEAGAGPWQPQRSAARDVLYLPLMVQDRPLGAVVFYRLKPDARPLVPASDARLTLLGLEMTAALAGESLRQPARFFELAQQMLRLTGTDWCEVALWDPARHEFHITLSYGEMIWPDESRPEIDLDRFQGLGHVLGAGTPLAGTTTDGPLRAVTEVGDGRSVLGVPLVIKGETRGLVLLVDTLSDRAFDPRAIKLAQALTSQAATALDNARLYRDLQLSLEELHLAQSRLVQAARLSAMGELAAAVAHQINNPLTTILGDAQLILQDLAPDDANREALEAIFRAGTRAEEVARRLLAMARQRPPRERLVPVDVNETLDGTLMLVRGHMQQARVALAVSLAEGLPQVPALEGQLEDVWLNLLLNARDAVAQRLKPQISVESSYDAARDQVIVTVWDNGSGVPPSAQQQIFDPFFTTKPPGEGTGLGLHICQQIVTASGGGIRVQSIPNEGTWFTVSLPAYHPQGAP